MFILISDEDIDENLYTEEEVLKKKNSTYWWSTEELIYFDTREEAYQHYLNNPYKDEFEFDEIYCERHDTFFSCYEIVGNKLKYRSDLSCDDDGLF